MLENVQSTILCLDGVADKLSRMTAEDQAKFRLDNCLGGRSESLNRRTIMRFGLQQQVFINVDSALC